MQDCGVISGSITFCQANSSTNCASGCIYVPQGHSILTAICVSEPLPAPRLCGCKLCTNDTCGDAWENLAYCPIDDGSSPLPADCAQNCFFSIDDEYATGICVNQLLPYDYIPCGSVSCRISYCGKTTCDAVKGCVQECSEGCCYSNDALMCQPCTSAGDLVYSTEPTGSTSTNDSNNLPLIVSLSVLVPVVILLIIIIFVLLNRRQTNPLQEPFIEFHSQ